MVPGFNTDFKYRGETYHVQTEDNGLANPVVVTLLYHKGAILASRRTPYRDLAAKPGFESELMGLMKAQHKDLMRVLLAGAFDKNGAAPAAAGGTGEHPAEAAAAVASSPTPRPAPPSTMQPHAAPVPPVPPADSPLAAARAAVPAPTPALAPQPRSVLRPAATTLDEAIRHYLETFASAPGAAARSGARVPDPRALSTT